MKIFFEICDNDKDKLIARAIDKVNNEGWKYVFSYININGYHLIFTI